MSYYKYQKYKMKYLSLREKILQSGGTLLNTPVKIYNEFSNKNLDTAFDNQNPLLFVENTLNNQNQIFTLEKNNDNYKIKHNNRCVKTNGVSNGDRYTLDDCNSNNEQLFNINKIGVTYMIQNVNNPNMCMDSNYGEYAHNWTCDINNQNQHFKITHNFKNNDDNAWHIIPALQNLILAYINSNNLEDYYNSMFDDYTAIGIANILGNRYYGRIETFSFLFCPLIYNALHLGGVSVPLSWTIFDGTEEDKTLFQNYSLRLSIIPGWIRYATYILTEYDFNAGKINNIFDETIFNEMVIVKQRLEL